MYAVETPSRRANSTVRPRRPRTARRLARALVEALESRYQLSSYSIWPEAPTPVETTASPDPNGALTIGVRFQSDVPGTITGLRFYKVGTNPATNYTLSLWDNAGTPLTSKVLAGDAAAGWRQVSLDIGEQVAIAANTPYVASFHAPDALYGFDRYYAGTSPYFTFAKDTAPLHALANTAGSGNAIYSYGAAPAFPTTSANGINFWVDVVFQETAAPIVTAHTPAASAVGVPTGTIGTTKGPAITATFSEPIDPGTLSFVLEDAENTPVATDAVTYDAATRTATLVPTSALVPNATYTVTVSGAQDQDLQAMAAPVSWSFSTGATQNLFATDGPAASSDTDAYELGVKFRASEAGYVAGVRFFKGDTTNRGIHVGNLWAMDGTNLASAIFTAESSSGWQTVLFPTPVLIAADTTYIASYHAPGGHYSATAGGLSGGLVSGSLTALAPGVDGPNGAFIKSVSSAFPSGGSATGTNYWVDVIFTTVAANTAPSLDPIPAQNLDEQTELSFTAVGSDTDIGQTLSYSLEPGTTAVPAGATIDPVTGVFTWTPAEDQGPGAYNFLVRVTDSGAPAMYAEQPVNVTVNEVNLAPVLDPVGNKSVDANQELSFTATASDPDLPANTLTFSLIGAPAGASIDPNTGVFTWTPDTPGVYGFDVQVSDGSLTDSETIEVTVNAGNAPPVLDPIGNQAVDEGQLLTFTATASDPDLPPDTLTFALVGAPAGASIDPNTGVFTWPPAENQGPGLYSFEVQVSDGSLTDSETIEVTVNEVNLAPVLDPIGNKSGDEGQELSFTATASDPDLPANTLTFSLIGAPAGASIDPNTGVFTWTPDTPGVYGFDVQVSDGSLTDSETIEVTVNDVNAAPVLDPIGNKVVNEGQQVAFTATASDPDVPANALTFSLVNAPAGASIDPNTGQFTWTPPGMGTYSFTVRVTDDGTPNLSDEELITVYVKAPVGTGDGLLGTYYTSSNLTNPVKVQVDPMINFPWYYSQPVPEITNPTSFSASWVGQVQAEFTQTYTFWTATDDGCRLWVNDQLIIDRWGLQGSVPHWTGTIDLVAGQKYNIRLDYMNGRGYAEAHLFWSGPATAKVKIPQSRLYSTGATLVSPGSGDGLRGTYYANSNLSDPVAVQVDPRIDFAWYYTKPIPEIPSANQYSVSWTGRIEPLFTQTYTFWTATDDGCRLWVNDQLIIDRWGLQGSVPHWTGTIDLVAGQKYNIRLDYMNGRGYAEAHLFWSSAAQPKTIIPSSQLYSTGATLVSPGTGDGLFAIYYENADLTDPVAQRVDSRISFPWYYAAPVPEVTSPGNFSVSWTGQIEPLFTQTHTFWTATDDGCRLWVNDQLIIDRWGLQGSVPHWTGTIDLVAGQKYNIRLEYLNARGYAEAHLFWSSASQAKAIIPQTQLYSLAAPSNVIATAISANQIDLTWTDNSPNETAFVIERKVADGDWVVIDTVLADQTSYSDTTVDPETQYFYRLLSDSPFLASGYSNEASATTPAAAAPLAASSFSAPAPETPTLFSTRKKLKKDSLFSTEPIL